jgi:hypothetical protein
LSEEHVRVRDCDTVIRRIWLWAALAVAGSTAAILFRSGKRWLLGGTPESVPAAEQRAGSERRSGQDRRTGTERRRSHSAVAERVGIARNRRSEADRRSGGDRRSGRDRRRPVERAT